MWTSSSDSSHSNRPSAMSAASDSSPSTSIATSSPLRIPARPSPRTWAIEPVMSSAASAASTAIELVKAATRSSVSPLNRPPQVRIEPPSVLSLRWYPPAGAAEPSSGRRTLRDVARERVLLRARQGDGAQSSGRVLGRKVALGLREQLVADHELAHVPAQQRRGEMRMELPGLDRLGVVVTERRLVPAHRVRERPLEQAVVSPDQLMQDASEVVPRSVV